MTPTFVKQMNDLGKSRTPFLFILDFDLNKTLVRPLSEISNSNIRFNINGVHNYTPTPPSSPLLWFKKEAISLNKYAVAFNKVQKALKDGNSYLLNLTFPTAIESNWNLTDFHNASQAKYKLWLKDEMVCFSPEIFIQIKDGVITSNPMKGTIDANIEHAESLLLNDFKEIAEHHTIVDLIRNDLNLVAKRTHVEQFRYLDRIQTNGKDLLQVSSKIVAHLPDDYKDNLGTIFQKLLPAGSITGAPKKKTVEIIKSIEPVERGYYTGIVGLFDGKNVDSGVMIRLIEQRENQLFFRSGGGITIHSEVKSEYQELIDKVYVPIARNHPNTERPSSKPQLSSNSIKS